MNEANHQLCTLLKQEQIESERLRMENEELRTLLNQTGSRFIMLRGRMRRERRPIYRNVEG